MYVSIAENNRNCFYNLLVRVCFKQNQYGNRNWLVFLSLEKGYENAVFVPFINKHKIIPKKYIFKQFKPKLFLKLSYMHIEVWHNFG